MVLAVVEVAVIDNGGRTIEATNGIAGYIADIEPAIWLPIVPSAIAVKHELVVLDELRADVWLMPEIILPWTLVGVVVLTLASQAPKFVVQSTNGGRSAAVSPR